MKALRRTAFTLLMAATAAAPVHAAWKIMPSGIRVEVARSPMSVTPVNDWNRWSSRPTLKGEIWTRDGLLLNELSFLAQVSNGETLYRETDPVNQPLPRFRSNMLPIEIVELMEESNRIVLQTSIFEVDNVEPTKLAGHDGVRFSYHYASQSDELTRKGEAVAAIIDGKLYMVNFVAAATHYYDSDIADVRALVDSVKI